MTTKRPAYKEGAIYRITIHLDESLSGLDGRVRAAREMATVATRQPGFISLDTQRRSGRLTAFVLLWSDLEAIDEWRAKIYEQALQRYGAEAWHAFSDMELETFENHTVTIQDSRPLRQRWQGAAGRLFQELTARSA
jgi:heme-degrading monooxygenase HmoA